MDILNKTGMEEYLMTLGSLIDVGSHSLSVESFKFKVSLTPSLHPLGHLDSIQYIRYEQGLRRKRENKNGLKTAKVQNLDAFDRGVF